MNSDQAQKFGLLAGAVVILGLLLGINNAIATSRQAKQEEADRAASVQRETERINREAKERQAFAAMSPAAHADAAVKASNKGNRTEATRHLSAIQDPTARAAAQKQSDKSADEYDEKARVEGLAILKRLEREALDRRVSYARSLETKYLDDGINADVEARGPKRDHLWIKWALVSKVVAHQFGKGNIVGAARSRGFRKITLTNGLGYSNETWTWDLTK